MTISIETKVLSQEENNIVVSMLKAVYGEYDFDFSTHKDTLSILARDNNEIIGHAAIVKQPHYAELRGFVVNSAYRNKGIGTLLEAARTQQILNDHSIDLIHGDIATVNEASQLLKESIGFKSIGAYLGSVTSSGIKQRTTQLPALWDLREIIKNLPQQLWIPQPYHSITEQTLTQFGTTYRSINDNNMPLTGTTRHDLQIKTLGASKVIMTPGADLEESVARLEQGGHKWIGISLNATKETTPEAIRRLNKLGFFYAELLPLADSTHITLQKLLNQKIDTSIIPIIEANRPVFNFVAQEYNKQ
jgi:GNAT superfamily N-acetyltransferase